MTTENTISDNSAEPTLDEASKVDELAMPEALTAPSLKSGLPVEQPQESEEKRLGKESETSRQAAPKKKKTKLTFGPFVEEVERVIKSGSKAGSLSQLVKLLKTGYDKSPTADDISTLFTCIGNWSEASRVALILSVETRNKRSSEIMRFLRNRLIDHSRKASGYPDAPATLNGEEQDQRTATVVNWIQRQIRPESPRGKKGYPALDLNWTRWALVSLMEEPDASAKAEGIYAILDTFSHQRSEMSFLERECGFFSEIGSIFSAGKLNLQKLGSGLRIAGVARYTEKRMREESRRARTVLKETEARLDELGRKADDLQQSLGGANLKILELENACEAKDREIDDQKTERDRDRDHWHELCEQKLTKQANSIKGRLAHEVKEARMALGDEAPNIHMALDRLNSIEKALEKLKVE